jgi:AraC family transcriptional regulator of adaptative response / DNA-3-methyladenine glycosylase II
VELDHTACYRALVTRDARFDGRFFTGVTTTGVYCRPICPARTPRRTNVRFFPCAAAAEAAGFRACRRCRPEASPGTPAGAGSSALVQRALRLIDAGALDEGSVETLAGRLGIGDRQLRRLFDTHLGASPVHVALARRVHFAKSLLHDTSLPITDVALASGFGSLRQFNDTFKQTFACAPRDVRRKDVEVRHDTDGTRRAVVTLRLSYRPPFNCTRTLAFLRRRATNAVIVSLDPPPRSDLIATVGRVRRMFDLAADPVRIDAHLSRSPLLRPLVRRARGIRVPGAWDPFELVVRAIVGQQISVAAATTVMGRLVRLCGTPVTGEAAFGRSPGAPARALRPEGAAVAAGGPQWPAAAYCFPRPEDLARADLREAGLTRARAETLRAAATAIADGTLVLDAAAGLDDFVERSSAIRGIGEWTAQYIAMRGLGEPDAFPDGDLGLRIAAGGGERISSSALRDAAEPWRPWRAYAAMYLWESL